MGELWETFHSRLWIRATLVAQTGLRIGMGTQAAEPTGSDLPILKLEDGRPFIPGSSLRGVLRSHVERIVRTFEPNAGDGRGACQPVVEQQLCITAEKRERIRKEAADEEYARTVFSRSCRVCRVFGSPWLASRVRITDLPCLNGARAERRDGVAIDRDKETVAHKYDFEVVPPGSEFRLELVADNLDQVERGLLWLGIEELRRGQILVGGFKGRGLGHIRVKEENVRLELVEGRDALRRYLLEGTMRVVPLSEAEAWLGRAVEALAGGER